MSKVKLKEIGRFKNGLNFSADRVAKGCKIIGIPDFGDRYFADLSSLSEIDNTIVPDECTLKDGDILFVRSNGNKALVGRTMIIKGISERITFSGFCIRFRPNSEIAIPLYLLLLFKSPVFRKRFSNTQQTSINNINQEVLGEIEIDLPSKDEQQKIINCIFPIIRRIEINNAVNDNLEATVQAVFKSLLIDYEGAEYPDFVEFEFGKYPSSWNLVDLDSVVDVRDGTHDSPSPTESGKYLITSRHLLPYAVDRSEAYFISEADFKKANERSKVEYGDILFSMIGTIGIITLITDKEIDFAIKNVGLFRTSQNPTIRYFILSYLKSKIVENYIASYMAGSTQSYVSLNALRKIPLILPTEDVLQYFEKQVTPLYAKMIENTHEIAKLSDLKNVITTSMSSR